MRRIARDRRSAVVLIAAGVLALAACRGSEATQPPTVQAAVVPAAAPAPSPSARNEPRRDLSVDESMGGHTLARHVGKTDAELEDRLRRERQISAASTYSDRAVAERSVGTALDAAGGTLPAWLHRSGRRPNLVLHYVSRTGPIGRSLFRGAHASVACNRALVVLQWDGPDDRFHVLTSYPDCTR